MRCVSHPTGGPLCGGGFFPDKGLGREPRLDTQAALRRWPLREPLYCTGPCLPAVSGREGGA